MVFCTFFDSNYLDKALVMYDSIKRNISAFTLYILALDEKCYYILNDLALDNVVVISVDEFEDKELKGIKGQRKKIEYYFTLTPCIIKYVLTVFREKECTYIDADLKFYANPQILIQEIGEKSVQIVEHRFTQSLPDRIMRKQAGTYCTQFNTFKNQTESMELLQLWREQCINECGIVDHKRGTAGEQGYLEDWSKYSFVSVLNHQGGGVAPWNIAQYRLHNSNQQHIEIQRRDSGKIYKLVFYHFHDLCYLSKNKVNINVYSSHSHVDDELVNVIYTEYLQELQEKKSFLQRKYNFYPLIVKHPGAKNEKETFISKLTNMDDNIVINTILRAYYKYLRLTQAKKDIRELN